MLAQVLACCVPARPVVEAQAPTAALRAPRFLFVLDGAARLQAEAAGVDAELRAGGFAYLPPDTPHRLTSAAGAGLLLFERRYALAHAGGQPKVWAHVCTQGVQDDLQPALVAPLQALQ